MNMYLQLAELGFWVNAAKGARLYRADLLRANLTHHGMPQAPRLTGIGAVSKPLAVG
jgi:hypothetical protein